MNANIGFPNKEEKTKKQKSFRDYFPAYYLEDDKTEMGLLANIFYFFIKKFLQIFCYLILGPMRGNKDKLSPHEVKKGYSKEAKNYDFFHHLTTYGRDKSFRREAGFVLLSYLERTGLEKPVCIDLCTGTGLCIKEIDDVVLKTLGPRQMIRYIGLDFTKEMLDEAKYRLKNMRGMQVEFALADVTKLSEGNDQYLGFDESSIDFASQVFGIGGIEDAPKALEEVLKILRPGGEYFLVDMHKPIQGLPGEFFLKWTWPAFETRVYHDITIPLVLGSKWFWRDTTKLFPLARLVCYKSKEGKYFGFRVKSFYCASYRWWLGLPLMPVAKTILVKDEISEEEYMNRKYLYNKL